MRVIEVLTLPDRPLDAAAEFFAQVLPQVRREFASSTAPLCLRFSPADYTHAAWRRAAVQSLAREAVPARINAVAADDDAAVAAALAYLDRAAGVTGQYLALDGQGAGNPAQ
jgi:hypothetical protein